MNLPQKLKGHEPYHIRGVKYRSVLILLLLTLIPASTLIREYEISQEALFVLLLIGVLNNLVAVIWIHIGRGLQYRAYFIALLDFLLITVGIHYLGGIEAMGVWVYALAIIAYASIHGLRMGIYTAVVSCLMYSSLLVAEFTGAIRHIGFGFLNPVYLHDDKLYLLVKLLSNNCLFMMSAIMSGLLANQLIKSKRSLERHREELEALVVERTATLTKTVNQLKREIDERERTEDKLRESEEKYRLHFDNVGDVIFSADRDFSIISISPSVETILKYSPEEIVGQSFIELNILAPEYFDRAAGDIVRAFSGERIAHSEYEFITKDGKRKLGALSADPLVRNGEIIAVVCVARDITDQKELEQQLLQAQKMESIGTLAGGIAHDFNNLLSGILGYASLMKAKIPGDHRFFDYIDTIEKNSTRAARLTSQLLAFSRGGKYEVKAINLNSVIRDTLEIIGRTFDKSIQIDINLSEQLPTVAADITQMEQVLMNLCINARDAMPDGGKLIIETDIVLLTEDYARTHFDTAPGPYAVLSATDTGTGMDKETMEKAFEPFFTTKEEGKGTGLGLAMVYGVVKNHSGYVQVYSEPGEGSTFKIYLPIDGKPEIQDVSLYEAPQNGGETILVVDDEESIRSLARDILETHGYSVLLAEDGKEAVEVYAERADKIDLVIIDLIMPNIGGRETFSKLKARNPHVRAILSTGYSQNGKARDILDNGARGFLQKPYQVNALLSKVRSVLDARI